MLRRFAAEGRGLGTYGNYTPWHQVSRAEPASHGRSHVLTWYRTHRQHHLLSDVERDTFLFVAMLADDIREQFPLRLEDGPPEYSAYDATCSDRTCPGTLHLFDEAGVRAPRVNGDGESAHWVLSTDLVVRPRLTPTTLIPVSVKFDSRFKRPRTRELLLMESSYWQARGYRSLLISTAEYDRRVANTLRVTQPWAMNLEFRPNLDSFDLALLLQRVAGRTVETALRLTASTFALPPMQAQCVFWQAVWAGRLPLDLSILGWPTSIVKFIPNAIFWLQNPIAARRSACLQ